MLTSPATFAGDYFLKANATNGLRRTNKDKRKAVEIALSDAEWSEFSDRAIAEMCGVGDKLVADIRSSGAGKPHLPTQDGQDRKTRTGKDGKQYPAPESSSSAIRAIVLLKRRPVLES